MPRPSALFWKEYLQLASHVEGGSFREIYRSSLSLSKQQLPSVYRGDRHACTHIYFMLEPGQYSAFHRIAGDELWHFYAGDPLIVYEIDKEGILIEHLLGHDPLLGQSHFCVIKGGNWFASRLADHGEYALAGCTVAPGFDFEDFEMAARKNLVAEFPQHRALIESLSY